MKNITGEEIKLKALLHCLIILFLLFCVSFFISRSSLWINIHEKAHCFGASLIGRECWIEGNRAFINQSIMRGEILSSFIYSGMPYLFIMILTIIFFLFRARIIKINFLREFIVLIMTLFVWEILTNYILYILFIKKNNDFNNIFSVGSLIDKIFIVIVLAISLTLIIFFLKEFIIKEREILKRYLLKRKRR